MNTCVGSVGGQITIFLNMSFLIPLFVLVILLIVIVGVIIMVIIVVVVVVVVVFVAVVAVVVLEEASTKFVLVKYSVVLKVFQNLRRRIYFSLTNSIFCAQTSEVLVSNLRGTVN